MTEHRYVRRKDNPLRILQAGFALSFKGTFDPEIYEEVMAALPENPQWEPSLPTTPREKINFIFRQALMQKPDLVPPALQIDLLKLADTLDRAFELNLLEAVKAVINEPNLPAELEPYRDQMLSVIPETQS